MKDDVRSSRRRYVRRRPWLAVVTAGVVTTMSGLVAIPASSLSGDVPDQRGESVVVVDEALVLDETSPAQETSRADESGEEAAPERASDAEPMPAAPEPAAPAARPAAISPMAVPDFANETNTVYTLDRVDGNNPVLRIRQLKFNDSSDSFTSSNVVMGGQRTLSGVSNRGLNSLGVTPDGVFYFTSQQGTESQQPRVDVWKYEMTSMPGPGNAQGTANAPQRVVTNLSLNSTGGGTIVGGGVNPRDGEYYFMYFSGTPSSSPYGTGNVRAHLYRYHTGVVPPGSSRVGEVAHVDIRSPSGFTSNYNGDIAFDTSGNLHMVVSNNEVWVPGNWWEPGRWENGRAIIATFDFERFSTLPTIQYTNWNTPDVPTLLPTSTLGAAGQSELRNASGGNGYNGFAFTALGKAVVQQGDSVRLADPSNFRPLGNSNSPARNGSLVDLASASSPPVLTVQKNVDGERFAPGDQFTLTAEQELAAGGVAEVGTVTTTGSAAGIQEQQIGPQAIQAGGTITITEDISANAANYSTTYVCRTENADGSEKEQFLSGTGREITFNYLDVPGAADGPQQMRCIFTNGPLRPDLQTAKSVVPASGTVVDAGDVLSYRLDFDNSSGQAPAEAIDYTDHLADVLDDADLVPDSIRYGDGSETAYPAAQQAPWGISASGPDADGRLRITGDVPTGENRTVWFQVQVKANSLDSAERSGSDDGYLLRNFLRPSGEEPPTECEPEDPNCTTNPISAWTVTKSSVPAEGAFVYLGETIHYKVELTKVHGAPFLLEDVSITDDLSDVLASAHWVDTATGPVAAGAKNQGIYLYDAAGDVVGTMTGPSAVDDPRIVPGAGSAPLFDSSWTVSSRDFDMPEEVVRAELWYAVRAGDPPHVAGQWEPPSMPQKSTTLTNLVSATSPTQGPLRCDTTDPGSHDAVACAVTHTVENNFFTVDKQGVGPEGITTGLLGHSFELRDDVDGEPSATVSAVMCDEAWDQQPADPSAIEPGCALFYPIEDEDLAGVWRAQNVPGGTYWLVETKAPSGYQLLAEPIRLDVAGDDGRLTVADGGEVVSVDETGYALTITDPQGVALPRSGGFGPHLFAPLGAVLMFVGVSTALWFRRRDREAMPYAP